MPTYRQWLGLAVMAVAPALAAACTATQTESDTRESADGAAADARVEPTLDASSEAEVSRPGTDGSASSEAASDARPERDAADAMDEGVGDALRDAPADAPADVVSDVVGDGDAGRTHSRDSGDGEAATDAMAGDGGVCFSGYLLNTTYDPVIMVAADFNGDGVLDLAMSGDGQYGAEYSTICLGVSGGGFGTCVRGNISAGYLGSMAVGDVNGDGALDVVVTDRSQKNHIDVLLGRGDGTFEPDVVTTVSLPVTSYLSDDRLADFNGDGYADLAFVEGHPYVALGHGDGTFAAPVPVATGAAPRALVAADFNGDGKQDLAWVDGEVELALGNGDGTFQPLVSFAVSGAAYAATGDLNGDGIADLVVTGDSSGVSVLLGQAGGTLQAPASFARAGGHPTGFTVGDLDGDGAPDVMMMAGWTLTVLPGDGHGGLGASETVALTHMGENYAPINAVIADFNGDGVADVATAAQYGTGKYGYNAALDLFLRCK